MTEHGAGPVPGLQPRLRTCRASPRTCTDARRRRRQKQAAPGRLPGHCPPGRSVAAATQWAEAWGPQLGFTAARPSLSFPVVPKWT